MCGSKVPAEIKRIEAEEMSWNTYDFPKPRKPEDIEMHWPSMSSRTNGSVSVMSKDATEGFVRSEAPKPPVKPAEPPKPEPTMFVQPQPQAPVQPQPVQQPAPAPQPQTPPAPQQPAFPQGSWQMPRMQETPSWTPYNVQAPQQTMQMPPIAPGYAPSSFTQAYGAQYAQAQQAMPAQPVQPVQPVSPYTQPQTAWTVPPQPQPGQQVFVTQPAQAVYIQPVAPPAQPAYTPVYPAYTQPVPAQPAAPQAPAQPEPQPAPQPEPVPPVQPEPAPAPAPAEPEPEPVQPEPAPAEPESAVREKVLEENVVATMEPTPEPVAEEQPKYEEEPAEEPERDEDGRYPERFFTFNKKNEEFQQLLNREYERLRNLHDGEDLNDFSRTSIYRKDTFQPTPAQDFFHSDDISDDLSEFEQMLLESTKDAEGDETLTINRDRIKGAALSAEDLIEPLPVKAGDTHPLSEPVPPEPAETAAPEPVEPEIPMTREERARKEQRDRLARMAKAREEYFASLRTMTAEMKAVKEAEFKEQLAKEATINPGMVARTKAAEPEPAAVPEKTPEQIAAEEAAEREAAIAKAKAELEAAMEEQQKEQQKEAEEAEALDKVLQQSGSQTDAETEESGEAEPAPAAEDKPAEEKETAGRNKTEVFNEILDDVDEENEERERREHSHWFLKFLLALLIVIAAAEGGTVALRHYAPDSPASIITTGIEQNIVQFVEEGIGALKAKFHKEETQPVQPEEPEEPAESGESFVLSDLIAENNKNIENVVENLAIGYDPQRTYDIAGLSASELVTDAAEKAAVCKTLIAYNSSWIDFINGESQDCLNYLKADGTAYRSAVTFDKIGQITEKFNKLEIGEIRKTDDTYYVFAGETIEVTQEDATAQSSGYIVYEMVPVGSDLKIKDYYNITN
jgi:hypothetical protein